VFLSLARKDLREEEEPMLQERATAEDPFTVGRVCAGAGVADQGVAELRLVCLLRSGDGYVVRGAGRVPAAGGAMAQVDISFGDAGDRRAGRELDRAVRHIQRWCELGTPLALLATGAGVTLRAEDGTAVPLPPSRAGAGVGAGVTLRAEDGTAVPLPRSGAGAGLGART
jgi:hypothetical protein